MGSAASFHVHDGKRARDDELGAAQRMREGVWRKHDLCWDQNPELCCFLIIECCFLSTFWLFSAAVLPCCGHFVSLCGHFASLVGHFAWVFASLFHQSPEAPRLLTDSDLTHHIKTEQDDFMKCLSLRLFFFFLTPEWLDWFYSETVVFRLFFFCSEHTSVLVTPPAV